MMACLLSGVTQFQDQGRSLNYTVAKAIPMFLDYMESEGKSDKTISLYRLSLMKLPSFLAANDYGNAHQLRYIGTEHLESFLDSLRYGEVEEPHPNSKGSVSESYVKLARTALRSFFRYCRKNGMISTDPSVDLPSMPNIRPKQPEILTPDEINSALSAIQIDTERGIRDYTMISLMAGMGLSAAEVLGLQVDDIDLKECVAIVGGEGHRRGRSIDIDHRSLIALSRLIPVRTKSRGDDLFVAKINREKRRTAGLRKMIRQRFKGHSAIDPVIPKHLRDTWIVNLILVGTKIRTVMNHAGINDPQTILRYLLYVEDHYPDYKRGLDPKADSTNL